MIAAWIAVLLPSISLGCFTMSMWIGNCRKKQTVFYLKMYIFVYTNAFSCIALPALWCILTVCIVVLELLKDVSWCELFKSKQFKFKLKYELIYATGKYTEGFFCDWKLQVNWFAFSSPIFIYQFAWAFFLFKVTFLHFVWRVSHKFVITGI